VVLRELQAPNWEESYYPQLQFRYKSHTRESRVEMFDATRDW